MTTRVVGGQPVELTSGDRVYFPDIGLTKAEVVDYYERIAERMVRHLEGRPLVMQRFPQGIGGAGFMHKEAPDHFPDWIRRAELAKEGGTITHAVVDSAAALVYVANYGCITPHVWTSRVEPPGAEHPDQMIFDLDPDGDDLAAVPMAARAVKDVLDEMGVEAFAKSSGSRGIHIHVVLDRSAEFDAVKALSRAIADEVAARHPDRLTTAVRKAERQGRLFIDTLRNAYAQHAVATYAIRPLPTAPVAVPIDWDEATSPRFDAARVTVGNVFRRLGQKRDPWEGFWDAARSAQSIYDAFVGVRSAT